MSTASVYWAHSVPSTGWPILPMDFLICFLQQPWGWYCIICILQWRELMLRKENKWSGSHTKGALRSGLRQSLSAWAPAQGCAAFGGPPVSQALLRPEGAGRQTVCNRQVDWHPYLQFPKTVQSSESIDGYGSNLIVLQAPVKMIIKKENNETRVSVLQNE